MKTSSSFLQPRAKKILVYVVERVYEWNGVNSIFFDPDRNLRKKSEGGRREGAFPPEVQFVYDSSEQELSSKRSLERNAISNVIVRLGFPQRC